MPLPTLANALSAFQTLAGGLDAATRSASGPTSEPAILALNELIGTYSAHFRSALKASVTLRLVSASGALATAVPDDETVFEIVGTTAGVAGDFTGDVLETAKGSAPVPGDVFRRDGTAAVYLGSTLSAGFASAAIRAVFPAA